MQTRYGWVAFLSALLVAGCGEDEPSSPGTVSEQITWIGSFTGGGVNGAVSLDLVTTNSDIEGEMVITRVPDLKAPEHLLVLGTLENGILHLELDSRRVYYPYTLTIDANVDTSLDLSGKLDYPLAGVNDSLFARALPEGRVTLLGSFDVPTTVRSMVWDGSHFWLSTLGDDYLTFTPAGSFAEQITVLYNGSHWTSDALTYDGTHLLGFLPITVIGPGGTVNGSRLFEFDAGGIDRTYELSHRTDGLAHDGAQYWSVDVLDRSLAGFDASGTIFERIPVEVPDPYHLEWDGEQFWTVSWYTLRLYKVGTDGRATAVIDVPVSSSSRFQSGLAVNGSTLWYGQEVALERTRIYRLQAE